MLYVFCFWFFGEAGETGQDQCGVRMITSLTCMYVGVAGQYWQSVKAYSGSVGLSYLAAQRRDCEDTDAVNALASLSVGVLSNKRYSINIHTQMHNHATKQIQKSHFHASRWH